MRKQVTTVLFAIVVLVSVIVLTFGMATSTANTQPEPVAPEGCIIQVSGTLGLVVCGGEVVDRLRLPTVKVKGPTVTLPPITLPPITVPGETRTVRVPGPTRTVVQEETITVPGPTRTVTPEPQRTTQTVETTVTATPEVTRQPDPDDDTMKDDPPIDLGDGDITIEEVGLGVLSILGLVGLLLLAMWGGYAIGYKDADRENTTFMTSLLDRAKLKRDEHS